ncbi:hypothetical protein TpMuguga_01g00833 [Theileria parva strain Muguga]|uniref:Uncharacterized protein n=1 Tax=Theileria parva TaxID=5875 RepID=Q4N7I7_THEPA|nr:uncharacterized protein TpMuguga_01g00833 [Theileria parva strain Muguga]EAN34071.1 hypothetical protein TpMuguga_01g00833 [Theileria parva strain Muguga]|eukprot:XP_766354.1 hypothetical protein [Theileria parva strain Muguga]
MSVFTRRFGHIYRTLLLDGSPANRTAKWTLALLITGVWIYKSEKKNPKQRGIFFRDKKAVPFYQYEVDEWNSKFKGDNI